MTTDLNRRAFLGRTGRALGSVALAALGAGRKTERWPGVARPLHHAAKVKRVIICTCPAVHRIWRRLMRTNRSW